MKLVPAYTIIEVTMALAISAITMTFMYKGKLFFERLFLERKRVEMETLEINLLDKSLRKDFFYSNDVQWDEGKLGFKYPNDSIVYYSFKDEKTYKITKNRIDTFNVIGIQKNKILSNHISQFKMNMILKNRNLSFVYIKEYSPYQQLLQKNGLWN
jgi:hypothetical protein